MLDINWNPSRRDLRQFGLIWLPLFVVVVSVIVFRRTGTWPVPIALGVVAAVAALVAIVNPMALRPFVVGWTAASYPIGWTISHLVLGITYFGLFTVLGVTMRLFGYDPMERRPVSARSFWRARDERRPASAYFRQF